MKKILLVNLISLFIISISFAQEVQNYKVNFNLDNIFLKGRDIKESSDFIIKNNIKFNFVKYNEKNSFLEITLRTLNNDEQYFSLANTIELISKKRIGYMDNLSADKLSDIPQKNNNSNYVVSEYISNPLLLNGYKFDMRIYVALTSINPLRIYMYEEGLARFATCKYNNNSVSGSKSKYMHLTNYSINKKNAAF